MAMSISPPSLWIIVGRPACISARIATAYKVRSHSSRALCDVPDIAGALRAVQVILHKLEVKMIEFLAEWMVTLLMPASHVLEVRAPHLSFMMLKDYWFRELYLA